MAGRERKRSTKTGKTSEKRSGKGAKTPIKQGIPGNLL